MTLFVANLISLALLGLAAYLIYLNRDGWGWCVVAAVLCGKTLTTTAKADEKPE